MERIIHNLVQGSPEWHQFRLEHDGASEAAAMLGLSKKCTRTELLRAKHTGIAREFSDFVQEHILDHGHEVEALARPMAEAILGDDLYPATYSYGRRSASCDGLTMDGVTAFEHKQPNKELVAAVTRGELPEEHQPQCQQIMDVTGAERVLFMVSDGTPDNCVHMFVLPDPAWVARIDAGWKQFAEDRENYQHVETAPAATAAPIMDLPAVSIEVAGAIALKDNFEEWGGLLRDFIAKIPTKPSTDQEFADCKAACGALQKAQDQLDAAESHAMSQISAFDLFKRTKALYWDLARDTRLVFEKLVETRETQIKVEIVTAGRTAFAEHIAGLNTRLGKPYMPVIVENFAGVIKGKRGKNVIANMRDAVDTELARLKIESNAVADRIQINLNVLREKAKDLHFLFHDTAQIVLKANDDLTALVTLRIKEHTEAEAKRIADIKAQAEADARAKIEAEQKAAADAKALADQKAIDDAAALARQPVEAAKPVDAAPVAQPTASIAGQAGAGSAPAPATGAPVNSPVLHDDPIIDGRILLAKFRDSPSARLPEFASVTRAIIQYFKEPAAEQPKAAKRRAA